MFNSFNKRIEDGRDLSKKEIRELIESLQQQLNEVDSKILLTIEKNDHVLLTQLINKRKRIYDLKAVVEDACEEKSTHGLTKRVHEILKGTANVTSIKGDEWVDAWHEAVDMLNKGSHRALSSTVVWSHSLISKGNNLQQRMSKSTMQYTAKGMSALATKLTNKH
ncbi:hypothetical protein [Jeotgalibacillus salarius]|uniref:Uncharacterized protein n=1 Tax=Jeotgalibacillus salarius TaxID=546023 RepID=A0A4Y8LJW4_9BACL|nr:hypothetical protein [Jeotgalibacillus salarius]TFE01479.1 hypothetical protein E2626_07850 [Jeotgalibacillus salarius]